MKRNGLAASSVSAPWRTLPALQKVWAASLACRPILDCSMNFMTMMYQLPMLMITRISSTLLATPSLVFHSDSRP